MGESEDDARPELEPPAKKGRRGSPGATEDEEPSLENATPAIQKELDSVLSWAFNIFNLDEACSGRPLLWTGMAVFDKMDVASTLRCDESTIKKWLCLIEENYRKDLSYHTSLHAADVLQSTAYMLRQLQDKKVGLSGMDVAVCVVASAVHDVDHVGRTNKHLSETDHALAILYNDRSILESHHAATAFRLTLQNVESNIFHNLSRKEYKATREDIIVMVLTTDMANHERHLAEISKVLEKSKQRGVELLPEDLTVMRNMVIKVADLSNPCRPTEIAIKWANKIAEELYDQGKEEKNKEMELTCPAFDPDHADLPKAQTDFIDQFVRPIIDIWTEFSDSDRLQRNLETTRAHWEAQKISDG